jgi:hypothetical protein
VRVGSRRRINGGAIGDTGDDAGGVTVPPTDGAIAEPVVGGTTAVAGGTTGSTVDGIDVFGGTAGDATTDGGGAAANRAVSACLACSATSPDD